MKNRKPGKASTSKKFRTQRAKRSAPALRRAARKPMAKRKMAAARRPFVEIKSRDHHQLWEQFGGSTTFPNVDTITNPKILVNMTNTDSTPKRSHIFPIWSYMNPTQGFTENDMLGLSLVGKYLTAKVNFQWPSEPQTNNPKYYMVHGWITIPPNNSVYSTPSISSYTRSQLLQHITNHLSRDFDQDTKEEFLQFKEAQRKDFKILGYRRVKPNQNTLQVQPTVNPDTTNQIALGRLGQLNLTFKWPLNNRKILYDRGQDQTMSGSAPFLYDNKGWVPFLLYYCPSAGEGIGPGNGTTKSPSIAYNDKFWYSDS